MSTAPIHSIVDKPKNIPRKKLQTGNKRPRPLEVLKVSIALDIVFDGVVESGKVLDVSR